MADAAGWGKFLLSRGTFGRSATTPCEEKTGEFRYACLDVAEVARLPMIVSLAYRKVKRRNGTLASFT